MKKMKLTKGIGGRLIGGIGAGAVSALWDGYAQPLLPASMLDYKDYVKAGVGVVFPLILKNQLGTSIGDGLIAVASSNIISGFIGGTEDTENTAATSGVAFRGYQQAARNISGAAQQMIGGANAATKMVGNAKQKSITLV